MSPSKFRILQERVREVFFDEVEGLIQAYLDTLPDGVGPEIIGDYREIARIELTGFVRWLRAELYDQED